MQAEQAEEEEVRKQMRMDVMKRMLRRMRAKGWMDRCPHRWWVSELLAFDCGSTQNGKYDAAVVQIRRLRRKSTRCFFDELFVVLKKGAGVFAQNLEAS